MQQIRCHGRRIPRLKSSFFCSSCTEGPGRGRCEVGFDLGDWEGSGHPKLGPVQQAEIVSMDHIGMPGEDGYFIYQTRKIEDKRWLPQRSQKMLCHSDAAKRSVAATMLSLMPKSCPAQPTMTNSLLGQRFASCHGVISGVQISSRP
jgi:hypothetical protein